MTEKNRVRTIKDRYGEDFFRQAGRKGGQIGGLKGYESGVVKGFAVTKQPKFNWKVEDGNNGLDCFVADAPRNDNKRGAVRNDRIGATRNDSEEGANRNDGKERDEKTKS